MNFKGIKGRWMVNGIAVALLLVAVAIIAFSLAIYNYYYATARTGLENKAQTAVEFFTTYVSKSYREYYQSAYRYTESFEDKDFIELQFVSTKGRVEISSYGISAGLSPETSDIASALEKGKIGYWRGVNRDTGERLMSVSAPMKYADGSIVGVMRYVSSTKLIDRKIVQGTLAACGLGFLVILIVFFSNMYFIRTIIEPIDELTGLARRIAEGGYGIQTEKKYDDEIGDLTDAINEMSTKISRSEKMQTEFISSVSHELRTPLTAITGWSETLMYDPEIKGDSQRGVAIISKETARLTKMVEELLEFTRIQDGRFNLNIAQIDVEAELEDSIFAYGELLRQKDMALEYQSGGQAIPAIPGDPGRIRQVFLNILDNAAKYGKDGKAITVSIDRQGDYVVVRIRDHGPGIPPQELPFVKKKFYKGSSKERGSGIGLAVCDEIVTRHGGDLIIANAEDGGVCVTVRLPVGR
ncbi:MAG: HAMP domain-containing histidine kinase [Oscillospiraceae bacterium]|jgi:signal transduction histidine kinase|nr:HAMP domain-containing histidine kinase [Oscillospiraceae bacterium]